jgi:Flp pilus assembly protein TadG
LDLRTASRGTSVLEFAVLLPFLLVLLFGLVDVCLLLDSELRLISLSREAANVFSRGAGFQETFTAITNADGILQLDGPSGRAILTRISIDKTTGRAVITAQQKIGGLNRTSAVGTLPSGATSAPAVVPNGRTIPPNMSLVVAELFSQQQHFYGRSGFAPGRGTIVLGSLAAF